MQGSTGETVQYSGRDDGRHMQGAAVMMSQEATKALIDRTLINERITKYAPTNDAEEQTKEDLQEVAVQLQRRDMVIIAGDMNAKIGKRVDGCEFCQAYTKTAEKMLGYKKKKSRG